MSAPTTAVVLAAGMGTRLRGVYRDGPKGFVQLGEETLIERSLRLLRERGVERVVIVAGHRADAYEALARRLPGVEIVHNDVFATTGSMASLARALERVDEDFLLLESDLFYEARALDVVLASAERDVLLASGPTGAGDEVWVEAPGGFLGAMSKDREQVKQVAGELVGIVRVSRELATAMRVLHRQLADELGHERIAYETDALVGVARTHPVRVLVVEDLLWGELDDESHWRRLHDEVHPEWRARCAERESRAPSEATR